MTEQDQHYRHNHYVPKWYQKRFMLPDQSRYFRLDLKPETGCSNGFKFTRNDVHHWAPDRIFAQDDLYTTQWGTILNTDIEKFFFGKIDQSGSSALDFIENFDLANLDHDLFNTFIQYMSLQKLRTPKGLDFLADISNGSNKNRNLMELQRLQNVYCAIWSECIFQIASAEHSPTKFIISDHPVTVYNCDCPRLSKYCKGPYDPDIRMHGSHTIFPLSLDRVLLLTNLSWVRNPFQNAKRLRPNPDFFRDCIINFQSIQTERYLSEDDVLKINSIVKGRAYRFVAAAKKEWLYPEQYCSTNVWRKLSDKFLLMPEPRLLNMGGEVYIGYKDGTKDAFSAYGHKPWQSDFENEAREKREATNLERFKAEYARIYGKKYIARDHQVGLKPLRKDSDETTAHRRRISESLWKKKRRRK